MSFLVLIFLLCLSMHASCYARNAPEEVISSKVGQKVKLGVVSAPDIDHQEISSKPAKVVAESQQVKMKHNIEETKSGHVVIPIKSVGSVSWHVDLPKKLEKNPGFYSDYSRPRTRAPCHN